MEKLNDEEMIAKLQRDTFNFFVDCVHEKTGLILDSNRPDSACSISVTGLGLAVFVVGVCRGWMTRSEALKRTLTILRFFKNSHQSPAQDATGYKGFYYHFLDGRSGKRADGCELSTIDTALLLAGMLVSAEFFDGVYPEEREVRDIVFELYARVDFKWVLNGKNTLSHGWKPERGFLDARWDKYYSEAHILYVLALGAPFLNIDEAGYQEWTSTFSIREIYQKKYIYAGPLFIHQMSQIWLDFRNMQDSLNEKIGFSYFENSRRATLVQREYAIQNPHGFEMYGENCWGISASDGPGPAVREVKGVKRVFYDYIARGAPDDIDDGTISAWAVASSLPFAPDVVIPTIRHVLEILHNIGEDGGFRSSFNATFPDHEAKRPGWASPWDYGLNHGPTVLMIENYRSGLIWDLLKKNECLQNGLKRAGFRSRVPL